MKILLLRTNGNIVDIKTYNMQELGLARAFVRLGHSCDVAYYVGNKKSYSEIVGEKEPIKIHWLEGKSIALNGIFKNLNELISKYDVVQVSDYDQLTSYWLYSYSKHRDKVVLYHGPYLNGFNKKYELKCKFIDCLPKSSYAKNELPCFAKSTLAEDFLKNRGFKNILTVGVGLDTSRFEQYQKTSIITKRIIEFTSNSETILYIGKIEERRNTLFLIDVLNKIKQKLPNIKMVLIGNGDEYYKNKVFEKIIKQKLEDNIYYVERIEQSQISYIYKCASVFVLPTRYEIFGMVLMEAMYHCVPIVTTNNGGSSTLFRSNCGIICDLDVDEWSEIIVQLLSDNRKREIIGNNERKIFEEKCSWDVIAKMMIEKYPKLS